MGNNPRMMIKEIDPNKEINTRTPLRNGNIPELLKEEIYLSNYPSFRKEGYITLYSKSSKSDYIGLFSFVLYFHNGGLEKFKNSKYYIGLLIYAEFIHENEFFHNYGMIIYTDEYTSTILKSYFSIYEKIIIAVVNWPKFQYEETKIEGTILRCLRFHALEAFPQSNIFIRDSDTIFPTEISSIDHAYKMGVKGYTLDGSIVEDYRIYLIDIIGYWEQKFINKIDEETTPPIIIGASLYYLKVWHDEVPFKTDFTGNNYTVNLFRKEDFPHFKSLLGVFAGFTNFKKNRPTDIWTYAFDYLNCHYNINTKGTISNKSFDISIGKDERIILFTTIAKYWSLCFFFSIMYTDEIIYYTNENITQQKQYYNNIMRYHMILNLKEVEYKKYENENYKKDHIKVFTKILHPDYISKSYNKKLKKNLIDIKKYSKNINLNKFNEELTLNELFQEIFKESSKRYLVWLDNIRKTPLEEIKEELRVLYKLNEKNDNIRNAIESRMQTIKFLYTSELPPIEFSDNPVALSYE